MLEILRAHHASSAAHCQRVAIETMEMARIGNMTEHEQWVAYYAGLLHDFGKLAIPCEILDKPGALSAEESELMERHSLWSEKLLAGFAEINPLLESALPAIRSHHERYDGQGYPDGLAGDEIPEIARIVAIVDAYDAMTARRAYRVGIPSIEAYREILRCSGSQFDPAWVETYLMHKAPEVIGVRKAA